MMECEFVHLCVRRREWEVFGLSSSEYNGVLLFLSKKFMHLFWNQPADCSVFKGVTATAWREQILLLHMMNFSVVGSLNAISFKYLLLFQNVHHMQ